MSGEIAEEQGWRRASPLSFAVQGLMGLRNAILPVVAILFGSRNWGGGAVAVLPILLAVLVISLGGGWLIWRKTRYRLGESDVRVEGGIINRTARSVPYERIQDVSLEQKLLPRLLGLVEVKFETGAGGKDELKLAFVTEAEGAALREAVRERRDGVRAEQPSEGEVVAAPESRTLFAMDLRRLATFGLFEFSLVVFAVVAGAAQQFDFLLPFNFWDASKWMELLAGPGHWLGGLGLATQAIAASIALAAFAVLGLVTGLSRTVLRDYGFRLEETPKGLRRRRGLLTRTDVLMPVHRVQALAVTTGIVRRRFGWHALEVVSLSQDAKSGSHIVVPFATMEEIAPVVSVTGFALPGPETSWHHPSPKYHFDNAIIGVSLSLAAAVVAGVVGTLLPFVSPFAQIAEGVFVALAGFSAVREYFLWRRDRHAIDGRHVFVSRGWLAPRLDIASRLKLQSVEIRQGPIARRRGYANLDFGVAGGTLAMHGIPLATAREIRAAVLETIARVDFSRLPG
ncbi:MAG: PH domain-containing protein [Porphyrobacter sp.]|nr:PH domain-containing protein [Porphyrobacter sp.]